MVQPNIKIYPLTYITPTRYIELEPKINELAKRMKTEIYYDFDDQFFSIKGRSQQSCDDASKIIERNLLPLLNKNIDDNMFEGTFEKLISLITSAASSPAVASSAITRTPSKTSIAVGRPLNLDEIDRKDSIKKAGSSKDAKGTQEREAYYRYETESDEPDDSDDEYVETFTFAKNIPDPKKVLTGPPSNNSKPADYLRIIGNDTDTECSLIDRKVKIVGTCEETVKEALDRFRNLQSIYKRRKRTTTVVPCVHYPLEAPEFGLYFCSLERYAHQGYVDVFTRSSSPLHVILPAFKNSSGNYQKPREIIDTPQPQQQWVQHQQQEIQRHQQQQSMTLDERMRMATLEHKNTFNNPNSGLAPDQTPLWGENKSFISRPSAQSVRSQPPSRPTAPPIKKEPVEDFPSLPSAPRVATPKKGSGRRVMRLTNQKSAAVARSPSRTNMDIIREYNLHNIKSSLEDGLSGVRGFKGDIKLSAKLGKILWSNVTPEIQKQIWNFQDLKDILVKERGLQPNFNNLTTKSDDVITKMSSTLPSPYSRSAYFEIHAQARNQPIVPYQPVVMYMSQGVVELKKIVVATNKVTEIDWCSLERKFDFQLLLQTEQTTRKDVKPYNTFIKKVAVSPLTRQITYENVPDFLEVEYILLKQTTKYRIHFPFVVEITRVEKLPLVQQRFNGYGIDKILGDTGKGQIWYDLEVFYSTYDEIFKENNDLPVGKLASWTVQDILGNGTDPSDALVEFVRCLLILIEKCEDKLQD